MPLPAAGLLALAVSTAALAGCGEDRATPAAGGTISVALDEYRIVPQRIVAASGSLRVVARNDGLLTHNFVIETVPRSAGAEPRRLRQLRTLHRGERTERSVELGPGSYRIVCTIANHETLGQYGELIVK